MAVVEGGVSWQSSGVKKKKKKFCDETAGQILK